MQKPKGRSVLGMFEEPKKASVAGRRAVARPEMQRSSTNHLQPSGS